MKRLLQYLIELERLKLYVSVLALFASIYAIFESKTSTSIAERATAVAERSEAASTQTQRIALGAMIEIQKGNDATIQLYNSGNGAAHINKVSFRYGGRCIIYSQGVEMHDIQEMLGREIFDPLEKDIMQSIHIKQLGATQPHFNYLTPSSDRTIRSDHSLRAFYVDNGFKFDTDDQENVLNTIEKLEVGLTYCDDLNYCATSGGIRVSECRLTTEVEHHYSPKTLP